MASRAFFRCRACGEPVVSGAYRCPVCGIDFPTGTPGAPTTSGSPAAVDPTRHEDRPPPNAQPSGPTERDPNDIAARIEGALGQELIVREPRPGETSPETREWVETVPPSETASAPDATETTAATRPGGSEEAPLDFVPDRSAPAADDATADAADSIVPGEQRGTQDAPRADLTVAPTRSRNVVVAEPSVGYLVPVGTRRSKSRSLAATLLIGALALAATGAAGWYIDSRGIADLGISQRLSGSIGRPAPITVRAEDGWRDIPAEDGAVTITADGTFRIRLDGAVYTRTGERAIRVDTNEDTSLAVRTVRAPTVAIVQRD